MTDRPVQSVEAYMANKMKQMQAVLDKIKKGELSKEDGYKEWARLNELRNTVDAINVQARED